MKQRRSDSEIAAEPWDPGELDFLDYVSAVRRVEDPEFAAIEAKFEAEGGGYIVEVVMEDGVVLDPPRVVAAGDENCAMPVEAVEPGSQY